MAASLFSPLQERAGVIRLFASHPRGLLRMEGKEDNDEAGEVHTAEDTSFSLLDGDGISVTKLVDPFLLRCQLQEAHSIVFSPSQGSA